MRQFLILTLCTLLFTSCEDVIDVELNDAAPRLVIDANINLQVETGEPISFIKLTTTAPFFDNQVPVVEDASVKITDDNGSIFPFTYASDGFYSSNFSPQKDRDYTLEILFKDEVYTATTNLVSSTPLEYVEQKDDGGFSGDQIELKVFFTDPAGIKNFYFITANSERGILRDVLSDEFFDGNLIFGLYLAEDLAAGDNVQFNLYGITEEYYNYLFILLQQTGGGGGPFETQPGTVRGNIINQSNPENYPLGHFGISEVSTLNYTVQ